MDKRVIDFLARAKTATYAAGSGAAKQKLEDGATLMSLSEDGLLYRDRYYGGEPYIGEELLFAEGLSVWGMNYTGRAVGGGEERLADVYGFLQESLRHMDLAMPLRGPAEYRRDTFLYNADVEGSIDFFSGSEKIFLGEELIYAGYFHGGSINRVRG